MLSLLEAYKKNDPAAKSLIEVALLYPGTKAIFFHRLANPLYKMNIPFLPRLISEFSRLITGIEIHPGATIGKHLIIDHGMGVVIGETAIVGDDCLIFHGSTLGGKANGSGEPDGRRHPKLGDRVMIGAGAKVLGPVTIGHDAKIGANAVVVEDVPDGAVAVGIPATIRG